MRRYHLIAAAICAVLAPVNPALAEDEQATEEIVIVASRTPTPASLTGVSVTVMDREAIEQLAYPDMADLLDTQVGVSVSQAGGFGGAASVRIRGEEGYRTRVILDGIDISDPSSTQISPRFEQIMTAGIDRIEILRGPQGLLWGADAGGVISLSSRLPESGLTGGARAELGGRGFSQYSGNLAGGNAQFSAAANVSRLESDGINARADDTVLADDDGYQNTTARLTTQWQITDTLALKGTIHDVAGDYEYDNCGFPRSDDCRDEFDQQAWRLALSNAGDRHDYELAISDSSIERLFFTSGNQDLTFEGDTQTINLTGRVRLNAQWRLTYGLENQTQSFLNASAFGRDVGERDNNGVYGEMMRSHNGGSLSASIRHDDNDDFGTFTSWRATALQNVSLGGTPVALRAAAGTGFRAPSLFEIAYNRGPFSFPPASQTPLDAEESFGWEIAARFDFGQTQLEIIGFDQEIDDAIFFDLASFSGYLQDSGTTDSTGLETVITASLTPKLRLEANATWNDTEDALGNQRAFRPELSARASLLWLGDTFSGTLTARTARDSVDTQGEAMENYTLLDAVATWPLTQQLSVSARVENLTDDDYQQVLPFNTPGRTWFIAADYEF